MKAAFFEGVGHPLRIGGSDIPEPADDEVLLRIAACGICGSDLHMTVDTPPQVRVHGHLQRLPLPDLVPSETNVKDIAQEVFLYLWLGRSKLPEIEEPQHWIFRIASFWFVLVRQPN